MQKSREVRLGVVLYGGVSLAIYINGVASQFFDGVMGRGIFRLIKALTESDIVVDIISGTSVGGINGVLLAYALCNQKDFSDTAALWGFVEAHSFHLPEGYHFDRDELHER